MRWRTKGMSIAFAVTPSPEQRQALEQAEVVLMFADGLENKEIARQMSMTPGKAAHRRNRSLTGVIVNLEKDAPRPGRTPANSEQKVKRVVDMTLHNKAANATH